MRTTTLMVAGVALFALGGCGDAGDPEVTVDPPPEDEAPVEDDDGAAAGSDAVLGDETMAAIDQLVADGLDRDAVLVRDAAFVTWSDGALGCPDEDGMYTQALVDGYRIVLEIDGEEVHFHGAEGGQPFRCDDPEPPADG